ncbi:transcriptional repressor [Campylobacter sp. US33a]|uniref:Transcriptional repressor n=1 Tax=Campylobacter sp. CCS1377 TaxID=3158229 RepID=A0AAU7E753_9BACT|nr:transcriptional repressor [Campylobacter sp. US33a]MCW1360478.1 transcriptional repressor [Campylobacter jejuni]TEY04031.1 Fur family transcriptional regulator [Campylobacter sp. US33a]
MDVRALLKQQDITVTELRLQMLEILSCANEPLSFDHFKLDANKTTFYRNMELFEKSGIVIKTELNRKSFYELAKCAKAHFICDVCHKMSDVKMPKIKGKIKSVLIKGICENCED